MSFAAVPDAMTSPTPPPRPRVSRTAIAVLVIGLIATGTLSALAFAVRSSNEDRILRQRVREAASTLSTGLTSVQTPLASAAELAEATHGDKDALTKLLTPLVSARTGFGSASIWDVSGPRPAPVLLVGLQPSLLSESVAEQRRILDRAVQSPKLGIVSLLDKAQPALGYTLASPRPAARYVVYAESPLPKSRVSPPQKNNAFADLAYAVYIGQKESAATLLTASTTHVPLAGRRSAVTVPFGDSSLHLVMHPTTDLGGSLLRLLPWLIAVVGVAITLTFAALTERLLRRQAYAVELAAENAQLYADQRTVAQSLQHSLLPERLPEIAGVEFSVRYEPGVSGIDVGGDWYDVWKVDDDHLIFVVGDVSGRGLRAASIMARLRYAIGAYALQGDSPAAILSKLSRLLNLDVHHHFATVVCVDLELGARRMTIANAGHPSLLLIDDQGARFVESPVGVPVGVTVDYAYQSVQVDIPDHGTILAFTDGLFERREEGPDVGLERLRGRASRPELGLEELLSTLCVELGTDTAQDDTAILGVRWQT